MFDKIKEYKMKDWIIIAMISVVIGIVFTGMDAAYAPLKGLLGPVFISLTFGVYALSALMPIFIVRKPGAALIGGLITALINILMGSPYGINIVVAGLLQGLGAEIGFGIFKYRRYDFMAFITSGLFIMALVSARDYIVFSLSQLDFGTLILTLIIRFVSASVIGFVICKVVGQGLSKTGLVNFND